MEIIIISKYQYIAILHSKKTYMYESRVIFDEAVIRMKMRLGGAASADEVGATTFVTRAAHYTIPVLCDMPD